MLRSYIYVPDDLNERIVNIAKAKKTSKAKVIRDALEHGLKTVHGDRNASTDVLFKIAELGKKYKVKGPKNSSQRIDELMWGKDWR